MKRLFAVLTVALLGGNALVAQGQDTPSAAEVPTFDASYSIVWHGISAGSNGSSARFSALISETRSRSESSIATLYDLRQSATRVASSYICSI